MIASVPELQCPIQLEVGMRVRIFQPRWTSRTDQWGDYRIPGRENDPTYDLSWLGIVDHVYGGRNRRSPGNPGFSVRNHQIMNDSFSEATQCRSTPSGWREWPGMNKPRSERFVYAQDFRNPHTGRRCWWDYASDEDPGNIVLDGEVMPLPHEIPLDEWPPIPIQNNNYGTSTTLTNYQPIGNYSSASTTTSYTMNYVTTANGGRQLAVPAEIYFRRRVEV